ncbi:ATP-binding protein [Actinomadura sp. 9N215]|uniref:ATP-binding protein n=1 Tax=Actinomadura sp. 9N215 TaxID=3375150 RepID=UPI0037A3E32A
MSWPTWTDTPHQPPNPATTQPPRTGHHDAPTLVVITGTGGVGKSALALRWLHQLRSQYNDGQLFTDLRGFSGTRPADPGDVLERFLRALGITPDQLPRDVHEQSALFRSVTAERRLIILLDNAASAAQVRPLLPGAGRNLVAVTTRRTLPCLRVEGAHYLDLQPLDETGARQLVDAMAGAARTATDPDATRTLIAHCGRLPLALTACAAHLITHPHTPIARLVTRLNDEHTRLAQLHALHNHHNHEGTDTHMNDHSVPAALTTSYNALPSDDAKRMYRLLGLHPGPDLTPDLAAAAADLEPPQAEQLLETLTDAQLLHQHAPGRYRYHDLTRQHALDTTETTDPEPVRRAAFNRITTRMLQIAVAAQRTINPHRWYLGRYFTQPPVTTFADTVAALDWQEVERDNLLALLHHAHLYGDFTTAWEIAEAMWGLFTHRKHYTHFEQFHLDGLAAAENAQDVLAQARMLEGLAAYHNNRGSHTAAITHAQRALDLERAADHPIGEASALDMLGVAQMATGQLDLATETFTRARDIHRHINHPRGAALMTRHLAEVTARTGHHHRAIEHYDEAISYFATHHEPYLHARALTGRADSHLHLSRLDDADTDLHAALTLTHQVDAQHETANIHTLLARLADLRDDPATRTHHLHQALDLYQQLGAPQATHIADQLAQRSPSADPDHPSTEEPR